MLQCIGETAPERDIKFAHVDLKSVEADDTFSGYARDLRGHVPHATGRA